jgi:hypothetical protein
MKKKSETGKANGRTSAGLQALAAWSLRIPNTLTSTPRLSICRARSRFITGRKLMRILLPLVGRNVSEENIVPSFQHIIC